MQLDRRSFLAASAAALTAPADAAVAAIVPGIHLKPDREEMIAVEGGRVYVRINGDLNGPRPPLVMTHGGPGSSHWYFLNATAMAGERAVILYDQLDSGRSDHPGDPKNWRVERFVDELPAIAKALGVKRWHMLGTSWGGTVALEYGARRPAELASVIVQSALISTEIWMRDSNRLKNEMPADVRDILDRCFKPGGPPKKACDKATDAFYERHIIRYQPPPEIAAYRAALPRSFSADVYNYMWGPAEFMASGTLRDYDGRPLLKKLDGKRTLFTTGEYDEALPSTIAAFAAEAPGATFREIPDAAHMIMNDNPAAYLAVLRDWLTQHD